MNVSLRTRALPLLLVAPLALAACTTATPPAPDPAPAVSLDDAEEPAEEDADARERQEVATAHPRLVTAYDGGLLVVDGLTLDVIADIELPGFNRLNPLGDDRHVLVSTTAGAQSGFRVLDAGTWSSSHGDHDHHYVAAPELTDIVFAAEAPGHAIPHGGVTTLFDDATGAIQIFDPAAVTEGMPDVETLSTPAPHHGFAFVLDSGELVTTVGDESSRSGIRVLRDGEEIARNEDCPGVHGEGVAKDEVVVAGCEDGVLLYRDGELVKVPSPHEYGRIGNQYVTATSPIALGDYKHDREQGISLHEVTLIDTAQATLDVVHLPQGVEYTWRGLGRGPADEALVLGTDGSLHVLDPTTGAALASYPAIEPWQAPEEWQSPHPALTVLEETAYITSPATRTIVAIDIPTGETYLSATLPVEPNEVTVVSG